jgi:hypothetical protein
MLIQHGFKELLLVEAEVKKSQVNEDPRKGRARMKMCQFPCMGTLQITVDNDNLELPVRLKLKHHQSHLNYVDIFIGGDIRDFVEDYKHDSAANGSRLGSRFSLNANQ